MDRSIGVVALALSIAACSPVTPASLSVPSTASSPAPNAAAGALPILVDTDLAGDDILALMALLREPAVDVRAIVVDGNGEVTCPQGATNVRNLLGAFGIEGIPVGCGRDTPGAHGRLFPDAWRAGADAFYGVRLPPISGAADPADGATLIADTAAASPQPLTMVALGPWSNIADALAAHPDLQTHLAGIHAMAGAIDVPGNMAIGDITPEQGVEWNVGVDPDAFAAVLDSGLPITIVPLDATNHVPVPADFAATLAKDHAAAGADIAMEMFARSPALTEDASFWDTLASAALVMPKLVTWEDMAVTVDRDGTSAGRIRRAGDGRSIRAAMSAEPAAFMTALLTALRRGAPRAHQVELGGTLDVTWDGSACHLAASAELSAGDVLLRISNGSDTPVSVFLAGVGAARTWADAQAFVATADFSDPNLAVPDWVVRIDATATAQAGGAGVAIASVPAGPVGALCATGDWPDVLFVPSDSAVMPG